MRQEKEIRKSLEKTVRALTPDLYQKVALAPVEKLSQPDLVVWQAPVRRSAGKRRKLLFAACCAAVLLVIGGTASFVRPDCYVTMDINPSIELTVNRAGRVTDCTAVNGDGADVLRDGSIRYETAEDAVEEILEICEEKGYLTENGALLITVRGKNYDRANALREAVIRETKDTLEDAEVRFHSAVLAADRYEELAAVHKVSYGRCYLVEYVKEYGNSVPADDVLWELSVGQLLSLLEEGSETEASGALPQNAEPGNSAPGKWQASPAPADDDNDGDDNDGDDNDNDGDDNDDDNDNDDNDGNGDDEDDD